MKEHFYSPEMWFRDFSIPFSISWCLCFFFRSKTKGQRAVYQFIKQNEGKASAPKILWMQCIARYLCHARPSAHRLNNCSCTVPVCSCWSRCKYLDECLSMVLSVAHVNIVHQADCRVRTFTLCCIYHRYHISCHGAVSCYYAPVKWEVVVSALYNVLWRCVI